MDNDLPYLSRHLRRLYGRWAVISRVGDRMSFFVQTILGYLSGLALSMTLTPYLLHVLFG